MDSRKNHDGRYDPTGSGQNQRDRRSLPPINKRPRFNRPTTRQRRFVETEREIESNRPSTQQDERIQTAGATPSASQSMHLPPIIIGTGIGRARDNPSPVRQTASSPNHLALPPIQSHRAPTPRPPQTLNNWRDRHNVSDGFGTSSGLNYRVEFPSPSPVRSSRTSSRNSAQANREENSASRNANSASHSNASRLGGNISRQSVLQGSTSAKARDNAPSTSSMMSSAGQPVPPNYQHQGSNSDGALIINGIKKQPVGRVCNSNTLRRHSTGGKMVPKHEKTNQGLAVIKESLLKPKPPKEPKTQPPSSEKQPSRTSVKSKRSSNLQNNASQASQKQPSRTSVKSKRSSTLQNNTSQASQKQPSRASLKSKTSSNRQNNTVQAKDDYPPDYEPLSGEEEARAASNSRAPSSKAVSRPPSSIPEEIEEDGRYDYSDDKFEVYEEERPQSGSRPNSEASIPEELPGQSKPYNYKDDDIPPETDIPEEIVTYSSSDDQDDDEDDDSRSTSRC